jgi:hypothetical protein
MPLIAYREQRFNGKARATVEQAKLILAEYDEAGYVLTLRQLYYQFVSRNLIANTEKEYKRLGRIITDAREVGEIDWYAIEDRGRQCLLHGHEDDPRNVLKGIERVIRLNPWRDQDVYLESWVEKSALEGVISRPANRWRSPYMACKGYLSASEAWRAGRRFEKAIAEGKRPVLIHLGDHDPSGIDMTRDNGARLALFARMGVEVVRVALNMDQVEQYGPPPNPAKQQDSRFEGYQTLHGNESWELDALQPQVIDQLVSDQIESYIDKDKWAATLAREQELRKPLMNLAHRYDEIVRLSLSGEMPLERLARLDPLIPQLDNTYGGGQGLLDRAAVRLLLEHQDVREATLELVSKTVDTAVATLPDTRNWGDEPDFQEVFTLGAGRMLDDVRARLEGMDRKAIRFTPEAEALAGELQDMSVALQAANEPTPAPDRPEDDDEPDDTETDPDDVDAVEKDLYGPEED